MVSSVKFIVDSYMVVMTGFADGNTRLKVGAEVGVVGVVGVAVK